VQARTEEASSSGVTLRRQLVQLFVRHVMQHDGMGELLNTPLDREVRLWCTVCCGYCVYACYGCAET
jgi:hypothetical protein